MPADGAALVKRYNTLKNERHNFDDRWETMAPYLAPSRQGIITQYSPGEKQTRNVYDSTMMMAAEVMAMFMAGNVINPAQQWLSWRPHDPLANTDNSREFCEECRDRFLKRLSASPFYAEGPESLIDYGGFGTGFLLIEEAPQPSNRTLNGFRGFYFNSVKTGRFVISEGADGLVDTAMREFKFTARIAVDQWGERVSEGIRSAAGTGNQPDKLYKFIHAIYPRPKYEQHNGGSIGMPWASCWVEFESKTVVHEGGYKTFPAAIPRYQKTPGEVYGRGRGDLAFPDTWTLNTAKRMGLEDWALKIRPPVLQRHDSVIGTLRLVPAGGTSVNTHGGRIQDAIMPFQTGSNPEVSHIKEEELRRSIREIFYVDAIRQLLQVEKSEMTAFEFAKKIELLFKILGPVYGRLEWEYLHRIADICFDLMYDAGEFPPAPPEMINSNGKILTEFQNPIARAQRAGDAEALTLVVNDLAPLQQLFPQILDRIDPDKTADGIMEIRGFPARWTRNDKQLIMFRQAKQDQNAKDAALTDATQVADSAGKIAPLVKALQTSGAGTGPVK